MFQHEAMRDAWQGEALGYAGHVSWEEASPDSMSGQKLIPDAPGQAPTVGQRDFCPERSRAFARPQRPQVADQLPRFHFGHHRECRHAGRGQSLAE